MGYWNEERVDATFAELGSLGVNFVIDYALTSPENESWRDAFQHYMDAAQHNGIGVAFCLYPLLSGMSVREPGAHMDDVVDLVNELRAYPAIKAWYVHDEVLPSISGDAGTKLYNISLEQMRSLYLRIKRADPSRPQICVWNFLPPLETFDNVYKDSDMPGGRPAWMQRGDAFEHALGRMVQGSCDWVLVDNYPVGAPWRDAQSALPEVDVAQVVTRAAALKRPQQQLLFVFQAFSWEQYNKDKALGAPFPTTAEMQAMLSAAQLSGATGAIGYSWFDLADDIPDHYVAGKPEALERFRDVLRSLSGAGWPPALPPAVQ